MIVQTRPLVNAKTPLESVPRDWLKYIEPFVARRGFEPCWIWCQMVDMNGYPTATINKKQLNVRTFIAKMFWELPDRTRISMTCERRNCINPHHFVFNLPGGRRRRARVTFNHGKVIEPAEPAA
jgi:hypothetical protein